MQTRPANYLTKKLAFAAFVVGLAWTASVAGTTWEDRQGRFALDLPEGYELKVDSTNVLYVFGAQDPLGNIALTYSGAFSDLGETFDSLVTGIVNNGLGAPPSASVVGLSLNGCAARWTEYRTSAEFDGREVEFLVFVGAVFSPNEGGAGFVAVSPAEGGEDRSETMRRTFESIRLYDPPRNPGSDADTRAADAEPTIVAAVGTP